MNRVAACFFGEITEAGTSTRFLESIANTLEPSGRILRTDGAGLARYESGELHRQTFQRQPRRLVVSPLEYDERSQRELGSTHERRNPWCLEDIRNRIYRLGAVSGQLEEQTPRSAPVDAVCMENIGWFYHDTHRWKLVSDATNRFVIASTEDDRYGGVWVRMG
jgi:hypothetical protein